MRMALENSKKHWRYEFMRPADLREAVQTLPVAWLVLSPLEWHGEALSFGCDPAIGQKTCERAWELAGGVLIPTLYIGTGTNYKTFEPDKGLTDYWEMEIISHERHPGSLFVRPITLELVLRDYLHFLQREGFKLCVVVTGHGAIEHLQVIDEVCESYNHLYSTGKGCLNTYFWKGANGPIPEELLFPGAGGHADFNEASLLGGVNPDLVDKSRFATGSGDRKIGLSSENTGKIDFDKGRKCVEFSAEQLAGKVRDLVREMKIG